VRRGVANDLDAGTLGILARTAVPTSVTGQRIRRHRWPRLRLPGPAQTMSAGPARDGCGQRRRATCGHRRAHHTPGRHRPAT